ncbi:unnamed protein product [Didymodactylos carnosus]|uniref:Metalloendopeptidase n=1 Tax=Didymodactylos carnosus TaxID=1234261 RepID=A0A815GM83_9BILA|nr:unnamed protein product [Didymodactylos carnosus]CAF1340722.1 unnamed protein product [Didymodactylos carnosus]CAF3816208.1 unnamed protein product [Didymodactylos carnosus]CAF4201340.1 unnamed protein product [Didymodactylos carnosus]
MSHPISRVFEVISFISEASTKTCIRFVPRQNNERAFVRIIRDDNTCGVAIICRTGNEQWAKFGGGCIKSTVMVHELGHTLCFGHEQTRFDRDNYISYRPGCNPDGKDNNHETTRELFYDYVSSQHYNNDGCYNAKLPGVTTWGSGDRGLSVLDINKFNSYYECGGCLSYRWKPYAKVDASTMIAGGKEYTGEQQYICRVYHNGDIIPGKGKPNHGCWVGYNGVEYHYTDKYEILTDPSRSNSYVWRQDNNQPSNAIAGGRDNVRNTLYISKCNLQLHGYNLQLTGKFHNGAAYATFAGVEYKCPSGSYQILVC